MAGSPLDCSGFDLVPPSAATLIESLRGVGYSLPAAIADILDNSITAGAGNVWLTFDWNEGEPTIAIRDDGRGMSSQELVDAMRLGDLLPGRTRSPTDLGRFGLGLKTASFSQCRRLTVASRCQGEGVAVRRWDLDHIKTTSGAWQLLQSAAPGSESYLIELNSTPRGTMVLWEQLDHLTEGESDNEATQTLFLEAIDRVEEHLSMVFQRYIEGKAPRVRLFINGTEEKDRVRRWDPFMEVHPATIRRPVERIFTRSGIVDVQGFVLPHRDRLSEKEVEENAGPNGWTAQQGFYIYRNKRLLTAGGWLGLGSPRRWAQEEAFRLARLKVDITSAADTDWKIDIKKSTARPPQYLRNRLRALGEDARQIARQVFAHRGTYGAKPATPDLQRTWVALGGPQGVRYRINRGHPTIKAVLNSATIEARAVETALRVIEETVPVQRIWLDASDHGEVSTGAFSDAGASETGTILKIVYRDLRRRAGMTPVAAREHLKSVEPFNQFPDLIAALPDEPDEDHP